MRMDRIEGLLHPAFHGTYFSSFDMTPELDVIVKNRNAFAEATKIKKWGNAHLNTKPVDDFSSMNYDHPEEYKVEIGFRPRYLFMFHQYKDTAFGIPRKFLGAFQLLPPMYCLDADSFQANAETIGQLNQIISSVFLCRFSKNVVLSDSVSEVVL